MFKGSYSTFTQLPVIDGSVSSVGDTAYTMDDGSMWWAIQPTAPPGANPAWSYVDTIRGASGPQGEPGVGTPGPQGQIGPQGLRGAQGPTGPAGRNSFSYLSVAFSVPALGSIVSQPVSDTSWMEAGQLLYIPGAGTFNVVGSPTNPNLVTLANSGDPNNAPSGTMISAGTLISPANMRGPVGPQGPAGPQGVQGPQGVGGASAFTQLAQNFTVPSAQAIAFVVDASAFSVGLIVYLSGGGYFSITALNTSTNTLTLFNQGWSGGAPIGTVITAGSTVSGTGPQGPQGSQGPMGPQGPQGLVGTSPTGTIAMFGAPTPPSGWLNCDGSAVSRLQYSGLFNVISTTFGIGDGSSTFNLPNMKNAFAIGASTSYSLGSSGGEATHTLTTAELAVHTHVTTEAPHTHVENPHTHSDTGHSHNYTAFGDGGGSGMQSGSGHSFLGFTGGTTVGYANITTTTTTMQTAVTGLTINNSGSGAAHNNIPPFVAVNYIIKV